MQHSTEYRENIEKQRTDSKPALGFYLCLLTLFSRFCARSTSRNPSLLLGTSDHASSILASNLLVCRQADLLRLLGILMRLPWLFHTFWRWAVKREKGQNPLFCPFSKPAFQCARNPSSVVHSTLSISYGLLLYERPIHGVRWPLPFSRETHVCFFSSCWKVGMSFSSLVLLYFTLKYAIKRAAKVSKKT